MNDSYKCPRCGSESVKVHDGCAYACGDCEWVKGVPPQRRTTKKVGRNDLCPCGSMIKFKKCCLREQP